MYTRTNYFQPNLPVGESGGCEEPHGLLSNITRLPYLYTARTCMYVCMRERGERKPFFFSQSETHTYIHFIF